MDVSLKPPPFTVHGIKVHEACLRPTKSRTKSEPLPLSVDSMDLPDLDKSIKALELQIEAKRKELMVREKREMVTKLRKDLHTSESATIIDGTDWNTWHSQATVTKTEPN